MIKGKSEMDDAIKLLKLKFRNLGVPMIQVFSKFDGNGGGDLDKHEFTAMIQEVIPQISDELCYLIFDDFDLDKDGNVDQDEFLRKMLWQIIELITNQRGSRQNKLINIIIMSK